MSLPNPSDERPSEAPTPDAAETPAEDVAAVTHLEAEAAPVTPGRPTFEEQLTQSPYATSREFTAPPPPMPEASPVTPPPLPTTPVAPPPPLYAAPPAAPTVGLGTTPPPAPYAPSGIAPAPYQSSPMTPPVYTQQPYSPYQTYTQPQTASSNSIASLVCGILAWTLCGAFTGLPAAIIGFAEVKKIDRGESSPAGKSMAQWGAWLGLINCIGTVIVVAIYAFIIIAAISVGNSTP